MSRSGERVCVTAIFDGYERPKAPPPGVSRAVLVTDGVGDAGKDDRWQAILRKDHGLSPRRLLFTAKLTPHVFVTDADDVLWVDGSMEPTGKDVASLFDLVPKGGVGVHLHPIHGRDGARAEAEFSHAVYGPGGGQDRGLLALEQITHYEARGLPKLGPVWATGVIVWRGAQRRLGERWLAEVMGWSASDQIALPYLAHALKSEGVEVTTLPNDVYECAWFDYVPHGQYGRTTRPSKTEVERKSVEVSLCGGMGSHPSLPNRVRRSGR